MGSGRGRNRRASSSVWRPVLLGDPVKAAVQAVHDLGSIYEIEETFGLDEQDELGVDYVMCETAIKSYLSEAGSEKGMLEEYLTASAAAFREVVDALPLDANILDSPEPIEAAIAAYLTHHGIEIIANKPLPQVDAEKVSF